MDNAVALVRAYLQLNGYFTITEYPIVRKVGKRTYRTLTEIDVAALHLPTGERDFETDPILKVPHERADMIVGEVKEGRAEINKSANSPEVVAKVLRRFGSCTGAEAEDVAKRLLIRGVADTRTGYRVRLVAFGTSVDVLGPWLKITLRDVVKYIDRYIAENWDAVRAGGSKDPLFGTMVLLAKARSGNNG